MGNSASSVSSETSQHIFSADTPVRFSNELVDTLQNSSEFIELKPADHQFRLGTQSDTTRSKTLELKVQQRLNRELSRLDAAERSRLAALQDQLSAAANQAEDSNDNDANSNDEDRQSAAAALAEKLGDTFAGSEKLEEKARLAGMSRSSVSEEVEKLRKKLDERRKLEEADEGVRKAKEDVVACLRAKDRRPLDCWQEVEAFRKEVGRLEKGFVERTVR